MKIKNREFTTLTVKWINTYLHFKQSNCHHGIVTDGNKGIVQRYKKSHRISTNGIDIVFKPVNRLLFLVIIYKANPSDFFYIFGYMKPFVKTKKYSDAIKRAEQILGVSFNDGKTVMDINWKVDLNNIRNQLNISSSAKQSHQI